MPSPYRGHVIILAPYAQSLIFITDDYNIPISTRFELGISYLGGPKRRYMLGYPTIIS
jgi:hypothetical protein